MTTVDLTKVNLKPKSVVMLAVAFSVVLLAYGVGQWGSTKLRDMVKGAASGAAEQTEEW